MAGLSDAMSICIRAAPDLPPALWWITAAVMCVLACAAAIDAFKGFVPDILIAGGLALLLGGVGYVDGAGQALQAAGRGVGAYLAIWAINRLWRAGAGRDALGMGDAKWTALAAAGFGWQAGLLWAWGGGALLAALLLTGAHLARRPLRHVHFAPFLLAGLIAGLYWTRLRFS